LNKASVILILTAGSLWGMTGVFVRNLSALGLASMEIVEMKALATSFGALFF
jgi:hypothetical protein